MPLNKALLVTPSARQADQQNALREAFRLAIQAHVDATARARNYGDGALLASYAVSTVAIWSAEAAAFVAWRDAVWLYAYAQLDLALGGERQIPTIAELLAELPAISWPA